MHRIPPMRLCLILLSVHAVHSLQNHPRTDVEDVGGVNEGESQNYVTEDKNNVVKYSHVFFSDDGSDLRYQNQQLKVNLYVSSGSKPKKRPVLVLFSGQPTQNICDPLSQKHFDCDRLLVVEVTGHGDDDGDRDQADFWKIRKAAIATISTTLSWITQRASDFGGDVDAITAASMDESSSFIISHIIAEPALQSLYKRIIMAFGENNLMQYRKHDTTWSFLAKGNQLPREFLIGYDHDMVSEESIAAFIDFVEHLSSKKHRVSLFHWEIDLEKSPTSAMENLFTKFTLATTINEEDFPTSVLSAKSGLKVLTFSTHLGWHTEVRRSMLNVELDRKSTTGYATEDCDTFPLVTTSLGKLRGRHLCRGAYQADGFYHVPYAEQTRRFEYSARLETPWSEVLDSRYPVRYKDCAQRITSFIVFGHEDCLNLHIYVPNSLNETLAAGKLLPVMVFMHGGGFDFGTAGGFRFPPTDNALYDGTILADVGKVIVVSVNYRLDALGFLTNGMNNGILDGNYGIRDMVVALEWINKNIHEFGGDPNMVTQFGQSAGSAGSGLLAISPMTKGLIHRVIQESGSPLSFFALQADPIDQGKQALTSLGCWSQNDSAVLECLMNKDEYDMFGIEIDNVPSVQWRPTVDGVFLPDDPMNLYENASDFDLLVGFNYDDCLLLIGAAIPALFNDENLTLEDLKMIKKAMLLLAVPDAQRDEYATEVIMHSSLEWPMDLSSTVDLERILARAATDFVFAAPSIQQALLHSKGGRSTYVYDFHIKSRLWFMPDWATNFHVLEIPYVFGQGLRREGSGTLYNSTADELSLQMMTFWSNFAKSGDPNLPSTDSISGLSWNQYNSSSQNYMKLDFNMDASNSVSEYRPYEIALWNELLPTLLQQDEAACASAKQEPKRRAKRRRKLNRRKPHLVSVEQQHGMVEKVGNACASNDPFLRNTTYGCVRGQLGVYSGINVEEYVGIPYAQSPTGDLRFAPTAPFAGAFEDVYDATYNRPLCPYNETLENQSEDCLYLNVYCPADATGPLAVMVWIHSDIDKGNNGRYYEGKRIAALGDVCVVTFSYRLGFLGFASVGDLEGNAPGDVGLLDQIAALNWVQDNIKNFGGDPSKVAVFGDSDSSVLISYHALTTLNDGHLFSNIIHQSGVGYLDENLPYDTLDGVDAVAANLACDQVRYSEVLACLRNKSLSDLMAASEDFKAAVVVDGTFFIDQPKVLLDQDPLRLQNYSFLIGFTSGEGSVEYDYVSSSISDRTTFRQFIDDKIVPEDEFTNAARIRSVVEYEYFDFYSKREDISEKLQVSATQMHGDRYVLSPSVVAATMVTEAQLSHDNGGIPGLPIPGSNIISNIRDRLWKRNAKPTYIYYLTSPSGSSFPNWVGAPNGDIENFIWWSDDSNRESPEGMLADRMVRYWATFAAEGKPKGWEAYGTDNVKYAELNSAQEKAEIKSFLRAKYLSLWMVLVPRIDILFPCEVPEPPSPSPEVTLTTPDGEVVVTGYLDSTDDRRYVDVFRGLPYAEPPVGDLRFQHSTSKLAPTTSDKYEATLTKPRCLQTANGARSGFASEDCLYLDIWRPSSLREASPTAQVLVWICNGGHGVNGPHGQLDDDDSCNVDGTLLALEGEIVFVRVNYRTGVFGFLSSGDDTLQGNAGLSDAINALKWIYQHIAAFGGSRNRVVLAGNGFGAVLAGVLGASDVPFGTVQRAIFHSASLSSTWAYNLDPAKDINEVAARTDCARVTAEETISCLRQTDALALVTAAGSIPTKFPFGVFAKRPESPQSTLLESTVEGQTIKDMSNKLSTLDLLTGLNGGDGYHFTSEAYPEINVLYGRRPLGSEFIAKIVKEDIYMDNLDEIRDEDSNSFLADFYTPWADTEDRDEVRRSAVQYHTDEGFAKPLYGAINSRLDAGEGSTYFYIYQEQTDIRRARSWLTHGADFGEEIEVLFEKSSDTQKAVLGDTMRKYWTNFVKRGSPTSIPTSLVRWPQYNRTEKSIMSLNGSSSHIVEGYRDQSLRLWNDVLPLVNVPPTTPTPSTTAEPTTSQCPTVGTSTKAKTQPGCPVVPKLGTGIGLSLSPDQADSAIEALFGIALSFACILVGIVIYFGFFRRTKKEKLEDVFMPEKNGTKNHTYEEVKPSNVSEL